MPAPGLISLQLVTQAAAQATTVRRKMVVIEDDSDSEEESAEGEEVQEKAEEGRVTGEIASPNNTSASCTSKKIQIVEESEDSDASSEKDNEDRQMVLTTKTATPESPTKTQISTTNSRSVLKAPKSLPEFERYFRCRVEFNCYGRQLHYFVSDGHHREFKKLKTDKLKLGDYLKVILVSF